MKKRTTAAVAVVAALVTALGTTAVAQSQRFPDVPADHYAFEAIEWAAEVGVTAGYADGTFKPERPLVKRHAVLFMEAYYNGILGAEESEDFTRGDMMVILKAINDGTLRGADSDTGAESPSGEADSQRFPDVPADHYAFEAIEWAAEVGVTAGYADGTFKPERPLVKRHAVLFMEAYYNGILGAEESEDFTRGDMMVILKAINDGTLRGADSASRDLGAVCPSPLVVQTDWLPQSEHGALYHLVGDAYTVDAANHRVRGSMVLDGTYLGVELEVRSGGPAIGFASVPSHMHADDSIHLGHAYTHLQMRHWVDAPLISVVAPLEKSPAMIMWDPQTYPDVGSIADLGRQGITVNVFPGAVHARVFVAQGILSRGQLEHSYNGFPGRFVSAGGEIAQEGWATSDAYSFEHVHQQWGRPIAFQLLHDAGFEIYAQSIAVRPDDLETLRPCLEKVVPVIQQAVVSFAASPERANAIIVDAVGQFGGSRLFTTYSPELAAFSARAQRQYGVVGNGPDSIVGNFDADRLQRALNGLLRTDLASYSPADLRAEDLFTNEFIDESVGF